MISICTVALSHMSCYIRPFVHSICKTSTLVKEVIIAIPDEKDGVVKEWSDKGIDFKVVTFSLFKDTSITERVNRGWLNMVCGHALGLHCGIDHARQPFVMMSDPDLFFLNNTDAIYLDLMNRYQLDVIGIGHYNPLPQSYGYFPCAINLMCRKGYLPDVNWLKGSLHIQSEMRNRPSCFPIADADGQYLVPGPIAGQTQHFANPDGIFDVGCNLYLWNSERKGRWLSFCLNHYEESFANNYGTDKLIYPMNYNLDHYKTNFELTDNLGDTDLLYHRTRGSKVNGDDYLELYHSLFGITPDISIKS